MIKNIDRWKKNISDAKRGKKRFPFSEEHKQRLSNGVKRAYIEGRKKPPMYLKRHNKETKEKIRKSLLGKNLGSKSPLWKGGFRNLARGYSIDWTETLRRSIRERDKYSCCVCEIQQGDKVFSVHHIDGNKQNCNPDNLITLCRKCHSRTNHGSIYWKNYLTNIIKIKK